MKGSHNMVKDKTKQIPGLRALFAMGVFGLAAGTASAQFTPVDVTFGSNNDGDGGFTITDISATDWDDSVEPDALRFQHTTGSNEAFDAAKEVTGVAGEDFQMDFSYEIVDQFVSGNGAVAQTGYLFANTSDPSASLENALRVDFRSAFDENNSNAQMRIDSFDSSGNSSNEGTINGIDLDTTSDNITYDFSVVGTINGSNTDIDWTVSGPTAAGGTFSETISTSIATSDLSGDYFGFGVDRGGSSNTETVDFQNFSVVPEPSAYALFAGAAALLVLGFRRRR